MNAENVPDKRVRVTERCSVAEHIGRRGTVQTSNVGNSPTIVWVWLDRSAAHPAVLVGFLREELEEVSPRGFAAMTPERRAEIAAKGGKASHAKGTGHKWDKDAAREAGRKGGLASHGGRGKKA